MLICVILSVCLYYMYVFLSTILCCR